MFTSSFLVNSLFILSAKDYDRLKIKVKPEIEAWNWFFKQISKLNLKQRVVIGNSHQNIWNYLLIVVIISLKNKPKQKNWHIACVF